MISLFSGKFHIHHSIAPRAVSSITPYVRRQIPKIESIPLRFEYTFKMSKPDAKCPSDSDTGDDISDNPFTESQTESIMSEYRSGKKFPDGAPAYIILKAGDPYYPGELTCTHCNVVFRAHRKQCRRGKGSPYVKCPTFGCKNKISLQ